MGFVPASNVAQVELRMTLDSQQIENVLYFRTVGLPVTTSLLSVLGNAVTDWWTSNIVNLVSDALTLREVYITDLTTQTAQTLTFTTGLPVNGAITEEVLPNSIAGCVSFRTLSRGRSGRGRNYVPGLTDNNVVGNNIVSAWRTAIIQAYEVLMEFDDTYDWNWGVLSRQLNGADRAAGLFNQIVSVVMTDLTIDSQRRRLPGRGT